MAPKGGGKGGGGGGRGSSSASCSVCVSPLELSGTNWKNKVILGAFAVDIIVAIVLVACLIIQTRFKWVREGIALDKLRNKGFYYAAGSLFIFYILLMVDLILNEEEHVTTRLYYIMYIVLDLFYRIADILILAIILRTIAESSPSNLARKLHKLHKFIIITLTFLTIVNFAFYTTKMAYTIMQGYVNLEVYKAAEGTGVAYSAIYLATALLAGFESLTLFLRTRTKQTTLLVAVVTPFLVLHCIFELISAIYIMYYTNRRLRLENYNLRTAASFISSLTNIGIYLGVVLVGWTEFRKGGSRGKYAYAGAVGGGHGNGI